MANLIQIKRALTNAAPSSLADGELAWSGVANGTLYIGNFTDGVYTIGGPEFIQVSSELSKNVAANGVVTIGLASNVNFTDLDIDSLTIGAGVTVTTILDEDNMSSNSATALATQQSIKKYVDDEIAGVVAGAATDLADLGDVTITTPVQGQVLGYSGTDWIDYDVIGQTSVINVSANSTALLIDLEDVSGLTTGAQGNATHVATFSVDAQGRLTAAGNTAIAIPSSALTTDVALGTQTSGNYVEDILNSNTITIAESPSEGATLTPSVVNGQGLVANSTGLHVGTGIGVSINSTAVSVKANNGITVSSDGVFADGANGIIVQSSGINVKANNGITVTADGVFVDGANGISVTAAGVNVLGNNGITVTADGVFADGANGISVTADGINVVGNTGVTSNSSGVFIGQPVGTGDDVTFNDVTVSGDLTVSGNVVSIDVANLTVEDPLIKLAKDNTAADLVDIGFYGAYEDTGTKYAGLFRDASDGSGVFKLFAGLGTEPTTTVGDVSSLLADLDVGALTASSINGSSLTLTTDLAVAHGGTGRSSFANNGIVYGQNTAALGVTAAGTEGQVLQAGSGGVPEFGSLDGGSF